MHPIERLRYVARAGSVPDNVLVYESMPALAAFGRDPNGLLIALRQLIARQPESPGLLALAATMVHAIDPVSAGYEFADRMQADQSALHAERISSSESGGTDVIDSIASGPGKVLCPGGTGAWVSAARDAGRSLVVVTPRGSRLPQQLWKSYLARNSIVVAPPDDAPPVGAEVLSIDTFDDLIESEGITPPDSWIADCPDSIEIARC